MSATTPPAATAMATTAAAPPPLWKPFVSILAPMLLTNILQGVSGTLDGVYIGQMMGVDALAAVMAFFPVFFVFLAMVIGLSTGGTVLVRTAARLPAP